MDNPEKIKSDALRLDIVGISLKKFQNGIIHKILGLNMVAKSIIRKTDKIVEIILDYSADSFVPYLLKHTVSVLMLLPNKTKSRRNRRDLSVKNITASPSLKRERLSNNGFKQGKISLRSYITAVNYYFVGK